MEIEVVRISVNNHCLFMNAAEADGWDGKVQFDVNVANYWHLFRRCLLMTVPADLFALMEKYANETSDEDGLTAGIIADWLNEEENICLLRQLNRGKVGYEVIPYLHRKMREVFLNGNSMLPKGESYLPQVELNDEQIPF